MKTINRLLFTLLLFSFGCSNYNKTLIREVNLNEMKPVTIDKIASNSNISSNLKFSFSYKHKQKLAKKESTNNWKAFNKKEKAIGKYQFTKIALKQIGYDIDYDLFIKNPDIFPEAEQEIALNKLLQHNKNMLSSAIKKYSGKKINNIRISETNILAAAHLAGPTGVIKYLQTNGNINPTDGCSRVSTYLKLFEI